MTLYYLLRSVGSNLVLQNDYEWRIRWDAGGKSVVAYFKILSRYLSYGTQIIDKNPIFTRYSGQNLDGVHPEYKACVLTTPRFTVKM
jgi:hypothetical protein